MNVIVTTNPAIAISNSLIISPPYPVVNQVQNKYSAGTTTARKVAPPTATFNMASAETLSIYSNSLFEKLG
jgi:hypothetical protein